MRKNRKFLTAVLVLSIAIAILAACGNSVNESNIEPDSQQAKSGSNEDVNEESSNQVLSGIENIESDDVEENTNLSAKNSNNEDTKMPVSSEGEITKSKKDEYLQKLNETKKRTEEMQATDSSTYALKNLENERWGIWDELLNEIYGVLETQLQPEDMDKLRVEQREWIKFRDESALKASEKYKGGTQEHLEYVIVLANLTEKRCFELVNDYMK